MSKVVIIGGGPAGMIAAITAANKHEGIEVLLLEKNEKLGKKLFITGKGRCNITNVTDVPTLLANIVSNPKFLYSAFYSFDAYSSIDFFESNGLKTKIERGNRLFPVSDKSSDVIRVFEDALKKAKVKIKLNTEVISVSKTDNVFTINIKNGTYEADYVIIATGGVSYTQTGSTGDGYKIAKAFKHGLVQPEPGLIGLVTVENDSEALQGLALKNVTVILEINDNVIYEELGEMLFTHFGLSGPIIISASSYFKGHSGLISVDLKPGLSEEKLDKRILSDFEKYANRDLINALDDLLPKNLIPYIIERTSIDPRIKIHQINKIQRQLLVQTIKALTFQIKRKYDMNQAIITQGGIPVKEINPNTMASKLVDGLYFVGEVIDVDGLTGGFNLQIAYSTGYLAGISIPTQEA
jgi:predicted Rossmann fold flavoprotein